MDNKKNNSQPEDSSWLDDLLAAAPADAENTPQDNDSRDTDELDFLELDNIIAQAKSEDWDVPEAAEPKQAAVVDEEYRDTDASDDELDEEYDEDEDYDDEEYDDEEDDYDEEEEDPSVPVRKVRPKRKQGYGFLGLPHIFSTALWIGIVLAVGITLGRVVWICASDILAFGREDKDISIVIEESDDINDIADKLHAAGVIQYKDLFKVYAALSNAEKKINPGTYTLNCQFDYHALVNEMRGSAGIKEVVEVMIPEGYTCAQIFALLENKKVCTAAELEAYAMQSQFSDYWFLEGTPRGTKYCLEGFLFPDTYEFYIDDTPQHVFHKMLSRFGEQFDEEMVAHIETLNQTVAQWRRNFGCSQNYINANKLTMYDVVIIASMIEKESAHTGEGYTIASVIYNRLSNPKYEFYLNIDATLVYALGKKNLTDADLQVDSPYNTNRYTGLIPTPISNPGLASLMAALSPANTDYHFYALDPAQGSHHFSKTYEEHIAFLKKLGVL